MIFQVSDLAASVAGRRRRVTRDGSVRRVRRCDAVEPMTPPAPPPDGGGKIVDVGAHRNAGD
jgi:hypothetical protein